MQIKSMLVACIIGTFSLQAFSQISQGGVPYSFKSTLRSGEKTSIRQDIPELIMSPVNNATIEALKEANHSDMETFTFAVSFDVAIDVKRIAVVDSLENGLLYRLMLKSEGAYSLNVIFNKYRVPYGAKLFMYSQDHSHLLGAFTSNNNKKSGVLPVLPVKGDVMVIEYFEPYNAEFEGELVIESVNHDFLGILNEDGEPEAGECQVDVNCPEGHNWQLQKRAVAKILLSGSSWCTGALINNTALNGVPYFLTANHCISTQANAERCTFIFNFERPGCATGTAPSTQSISGSDLIATHSGTDFTLLLLSRKPPLPFMPYFAGWDRSDSQPSGGVGIHHPGSLPKKIATHRMVPKTLTSCRGTNYYVIDNWLQTANGHSVTEGGSSGSPLFNSAGRIIGQLYGGCSGHNDNCANPSSDWGTYGKIYASWNIGNTPALSLSTWLDPRGSGVMNMDGIEGCGDILTLHLTQSVASGTNATFKTANSMEVSQVVQAGANVNYQANRNIIFSSGFDVRSGAKVEASISNINCINVPTTISLFAWTEEADENGNFVFDVYNAGQYDIILSTLDGKDVYTGEGEIDSTSVVLFNSDEVVSGRYIATVRFRNENEEISDSYIINLGEEKYIFGDVPEKAEQILSLENTKTDAFVNIYPNPNNGIFTIEITGGQYNPFSVEVFNATGALLNKFEYINSTILTIDQSGLPSGIYYLKITMGNKQYVEKVIIQ